MSTRRKYPLYRASPPYQGGSEPLTTAYNRIRATFTVAQLSRSSERNGVHDPWRFQQAALELEREGLTVVSIPQSPSRMTPASERLYRAKIERRITHPNEPELNRHVANAVANDGPRGVAARSRAPHSEHRRRHRARDGRGASRGKAGAGRAARVALGVP